MEMAKVKDQKSTQMNYPAPYSQSWATVGQRGQHPACRRKTNSACKSVDKPPNSRRVLGRKQEMSQQLSTGLDPTVPHLKYGLFPNKIYINRDQSRTLSTEPFVRTSVSMATDTRKAQPMQKKTRQSINYESKIIKTDPNYHPAIGKTSTIQKIIQNPREQGESSDNPMFVFRPLEKCNLSSLTVSASTHLDIKPRPPRGPAHSPPLYSRYM